MIFDYGFGGLRLHSGVALAGLRTFALDAAYCAAEVFLSLEVARPPQADRIVYRWPGRYSLALGVLGPDWWMSSSFDGTYLINADDRTIRCFCRAQSLPDESVDVLVRRVLPRVALLFGYTAIHAAALGRGNRGLLLLGSSGAGKSTLCAALAQQFDWTILSDDISIIQDDRLPVAMPAATGACVWPDSRRALKLPPADCKPMPGYDGKVWFTQEGDHAATALPLHAFVFLDRTCEFREPTLQPLTRSEGFIRAAHQLVRFDPSDHPQAESARLLHQLQKIMRAIPSYSLRYSARYATLPDVAMRLQELLQP